MSKQMTRLSMTEASELLHGKGHRKTGPHQMTGRVCHWRYCARCGLIALNNTVTRKALRKVCVTHE